ncbi:MAG: hypothetical protein KAX99_02175 [Azonexus sp.]|nr:hypothetical protein [Azonexus sp.]
MNANDFGRCDHCGTALHAKYWSFDRNIEQFSYAESSGKVETTINIILSEGLHTYCSDWCANLAVQEAMAERGFFNLYPGGGPIELCAECSKPVDMTKPHVAYNLMVGTEVRKLWMTEFIPHDSESIAVICRACESAQVNEATEEDEVAGPDPELKNMGLSFLGTDLVVLGEHRVSTAPCCPAIAFHHDA